MIAQNMVALEAANRVKRERQLLRRAVREGMVSLEDALDHPVAARMEVAHLLTARNRLGVQAAQGIMARAEVGAFGFAGGRRVQDLTDRQLGRLKSSIRVWEKGRAT